MNMQNINKISEKELATQNEKNSYLNEKANTS